MKFYLYFFVPIILLLCSCEKSKIQICSQLDGMSNGEIETYLSISDKNMLVERIYNAGECKTVQFIPYLIDKVGDARGVHHIRFNGMIIGRIAHGALVKITNANFELSSHARKSELFNMKKKWLSWYSNKN